MLKKVLIAISVISFILIFVFVFLANKHMDSIGGDAFSGYIENNKYYISLGGELYEEVPQMTWILSYSLTIGIIGSFFIAGASIFLSVLIYAIIPKWRKLGIF